MENYQSVIPVFEESVILQYRTRRKWYLAIQSCSYKLAGDNMGGQYDAH